MRLPQYQSIPRFLFRCDASPTIGTGHLHRCMTLAQELKEHGAIVLFACRAQDIDIEKELQDVTDDRVVLDWALTPEDDVQTVIDLYHQRGINIAVIDHYQANIRYQERLCSSHVRWLQFDGYIRQPLLADWVLNTSPSAKEEDYQTRKRRHETQLLLGPEYALLRREFREVRPRVRFRKEVRRILLSFGGGDDRGVTLFCLKALMSLDKNIERIVLTSTANPHLSEITDWINENRNSQVNLLVDSYDIAAHMANADLALIAGGTTTYEIAAMGLPGLIIQTADNQVAHADAWEKTGSLRNIGAFYNLTANTLKRHVTELIDNSTQRESMASAGMSLVDCLGAQRVVQILLSDIDPELKEIQKSA